jgi:5'-deoxynucleotidase YfbR-like HD superfamily hydrolase
MRQIRQGGHVRRWHTTPPLQDQSVAEHSWGVAAICNYLWPKCKKELIMAALYHDVAESLVGDNPAPIKWKFPVLKRELDKVENKILREMGVEIILDPQDIIRLKIADMMELLWFCIEEERRGNRNFKEVFVRGTRYLQDIFPHQSLEFKREAVTMLDYLIKTEADL